MAQAHAVRDDSRPHAAAWWLWAAGLAVAALRTTNPLILLVLGAVVACVTVARLPDDQARRTMRSFVVLAALVVSLRLVLQVLVGQRLPGHVLFSLPSVSLPDWARGVSIGGPVTVESLLVALVGGLRLAVVLVAFGAANALSSARELLRSLPPVAHEAAVAVTVALSFVPELFASVARVRDARMLRGRPSRGLAGIRGITVPVLEDALEHSVTLAASMGARGFGRRAARPSVGRHLLTVGAALLGSILLLLGGYGSLAGSSPLPAPLAMAILGVALLILSTMTSARRAIRTRYRPAPFGLRSVVCGLSGWAPVGAGIVLDAVDPGATAWTPSPLVWPSVSPLLLMGTLLALLPLAVAPAPRHARAPGRRREVVA